MEHLDPELQRLLEKARSAEDPSPQDRDRNLDALARRVGSAALVGAAAMTTSEVAAGVAGATKGAAVVAKAAAPTVLALALKVGAPLVLIGAVGVTVLPRVIGRTATAPRDTIAAPAPLAIEDRSKPIDEPGDKAPAPLASSMVEATPAPRPVGPAIAPAPTSAVRAPALSEEVALLQRAERALRDGKPEQALSVLSEHARQFPKGELRAERTAARIAALCALHRQSEAKRDATVFLKQWPGSPLAAQVRASCAGPDDKATMP